MKIKKIYISKESKYYAAGKNSEDQAIVKETVECHAGKGIVGDRFYNFKEDFKGQITFISYELHLEMQKYFNKDIDMADYRRNVFIENGNPLDFIGKRFKIGDAEFIGVEDCTPCKWMDKVIGDGSKSWMSENSSGGLRAKILKNGVISVGDEVSQ